VGTPLLQVPIEKLYLNADQMLQMAAAYRDQSAIIRRTFRANAQSQAIATSLLEDHGLDLEARARLESKWRVAWSMSWPMSAGKDTVHRVLLQW
jgi:hypothetical protein